MLLKRPALSVNPLTRGAQGADGIFASTMCHEIQPTCAVCQRQTVHLTIPRAATVAQLIEALRTDPRLLLKDPAVSAPADTASGMRTVYNPHIASIRAATLRNLDLPVDAFVAEGAEITIDDPALASQKQVPTLRCAARWLGLHRRPSARDRTSPAVLPGCVGPRPRPAYSQPAIDCVAAFEVMSAAPPRRFLNR